MTRFFRGAIAATFALACGSAGSGATTTRPDAAAGRGGATIAMGSASSGGADGGTGGAASTGAGGAGGLPAGGAAGEGATSGASAGISGSAGVSALAIVYLAEFAGPDLPLVPLAAGDAVHLVVPPQGGHVLFIGARLKNARGDTVRLHARLKNPDDGTIATEEMRSVAIVPVPGDSPSTLTETDNSSLTQVSNLTACPDYAARALVGLPYLLELTVTELMVPSPREVTAAWLVTPTCPAGADPDAAFCACECAGNYAPGKCPQP